MKTTIFLIAVFSAVVAFCGGCSKSSDGEKGSMDSTSKSVQKAERKVLYWYDPMNPTVHFQHPGKSPFMDMDLQPMYADESGSNPNVVSVDPAMVQNIGVVTEPVERRTLTRTINTVGVVSPDEKSISDINTRVGGWVEKLYFDYTGMEVRRGQPMAEMYSPELIAAEQEFLQAVSFAKVSGSTVTQSNTLIKSARERLVFFGMSDVQIDEVQKTASVLQRVVIHSKYDGVILEKDVYEGQKISAGQSLFKVADLRRLWILADVFRIDIPFLKTRSHVTVTDDRDAAYQGTVDFVYPQVDPTARSVKVRIPLSNPHLLMRIGQYVNVAIHSPVNYDVIAVPSQAVINTGVRQVVAVSLGEGKFEMREVRLGPYADGYYAVEDGLTKGETIVTSGQFLIDSDANLKSAGASLAGGAPGSDSSENPPHAGLRRRMEELNRDSSRDQTNRSEK